MEKVCLFITCFVLTVGPVFSERGRAAEAAEKANQFFKEFEEEYFNDELVQNMAFVDLDGGAVVLHYRSGDMVYTCFHVDQGGNIHLDDTIHPFPSLDNNGPCRSSVDSLKE